MLQDNGYREGDSLNRKEFEVRSSLSTWYDPSIAVQQLCSCQLRSLAISELVLFHTCELDFLQFDELCCIMPLCAGPVRGCAEVRCSQVC